MYLLSKRASKALDVAELEEMVTLGIMGEPLKGLNERQIREILMYILGFSYVAPGYMTQAHLVYCFRVILQWHCILNHNSVESIIGDL